MLKKLENSVKAAGFKPTASSLNQNILWLVWPKVQQILCESNCDFIVFNHYMLKFSISKTVMPKQKLQIILIIRHSIVEPVKVLQYDILSSEVVSWKDENVKAMELHTPLYAPIRRKIHDSSNHLTSSFVGW